MNFDDKTIIIQCTYTDDTNIYTNVTSIKFENKKFELIKSKFYLLFQIMIFYFLIRSLQLNKYG
jgi:hypothetical protein